MDFVRVEENHIIAGLGDFSANPVVRACAIMGGINNDDPPLVLTTDKEKRSAEVRRLERLEDGAMSQRNKIEILSAGCPASDETVEMVRRNSGRARDIGILGMRVAPVAE